jgi:acetylornithine/N-succinyldiaminopimelate aminotransferase
MITVAAGDNVVRLLPPLIVSDDEITEGVRRIEVACARLAEKVRAEARKQGAVG